MWYFLIAGKLAVGIHPTPPVKANVASAVANPAAVQIAATLRPCGLCLGETAVRCGKFDGGRREEEVRQRWMPGSLAG
jgi:hypothetical protein